MQNIGRGPGDGHNARGDSTGPLRTAVDKHTQKKFIFGGALDCENDLDLIVVAISDYLVGLGIIKSAKKKSRHIKHNMDVICEHKK